MQHTLRHTNEQKIQQNNRPTPLNFTGPSSFIMNGTLPAATGWSALQQTNENNNKQPIAESSPRSPWSCTLPSPISPSAASEYSTASSNYSGNSVEIPMLTPGSPISPNPFFSHLPLTPPPTLASLGYFGVCKDAPESPCLNAGDNFDVDSVKPVDKCVDDEFKLKLRKQSNAAGPLQQNVAYGDSSSSSQSSNDKDEEMIGLFMVALG
jgi:hypothetical protein